MQSPILTAQNLSPADILCHYGSINSLPVNLVEIFTNLGLPLYAVDLKEIQAELNKGEVLGAVRVNKGAASIYCREADTIQKRRFVASVCLAHCCLHNFTNAELDDYVYVYYNKDEDDKSRFEVSTEAFARELLIPFSLLHKVYLDCTFPSSKVLARKFAVSVSVMEAHLDYMGISYYDSKGFPIAYS